MQRSSLVHESTLHRVFWGAAVRNLLMVRSLLDSYLAQWAASRRKRPTNTLLITRMVNTPTGAVRVFDSESAACCLRKRHH